MQTTSSILMVRPASFGLNVETAMTNAFQDIESKINDEDAQKAAEKEFDQLVELLTANDIEVMVVKDRPEPHTPDALFPNNWVSFHESGKVVLYPMMAPNRRKERRDDILQRLEKRYKFLKKSMIDLTSFERTNKFLEGTGSMVLDRVNKHVYACLSPRTNLDVLNKFARLMGYTPVFFHAQDHYELDIYHTNVMMCIGKTFAVVCEESITDEAKRTNVRVNLEQTNHEVIPITLDQMNNFAGNMLEVSNQKGDTPFIVMSTRAHESLTSEQIEKLEKHAKILHSPIPTIEQLGGGSVRCMMAEVFLPRDSKQL